MESINIRIENASADEIDVTCYSVTLKVPTKDVLLSLLPNHLSSLEYTWKYHTGILSKVHHSFKLILFREYHEPKVGYNITMVENCQEIGYIFEVSKIEVTFVSEDKKIIIEDFMSKMDSPKCFEEDSAVFWQSTCGWPDNITALCFLIHIIKRKPPKIIPDRTEETLKLNKRIGHSFNGSIDIRNLYLSTEYSDVVISSGGYEFPAHRLVLCSRSKYFNNMFSSSMKESVERLIKIEDEDMSTESLKEMLRYIYGNGEIDVEKYGRELFVAADKYGMEELKLMCERHLIEKISISNAIEMYDLAHMHGSVLLQRKAKEVIIWNKTKFAPDPETLKNFTCKYPELVFELFQFAE